MVALRKELAYITSIQISQFQIVCLTEILHQITAALYIMHMETLLLQGVLLQVMYPITVVLYTIQLQIQKFQIVSSIVIMQIMEEPYIFSHQLVAPVPKYKIAHFIIIKPADMMVIILMAKVERYLTMDRFYCLQIVHFTKTQVNLSVVL